MTPPANASPNRPWDHHACWQCGYDLTGSDLPGLNWNCPECGTTNLPGDDVASPLQNKPRPSLWLVALIVLVPGLVIGAAGALLLLIAPGVAADPSYGLFFFLLAMLAAFGGTVLWSIYIPRAIIRRRVPHNRAVRIEATLSVAILIGNPVLMWTAYLVATIVFR
ncbi:MAG: hypothetical protein KF745_07800 [Phycisphaeraceae bacterium]|nr:hypothetical protein [Phycisphaeraceae bacterium]